MPLFFVPFCKHIFCLCKIKMLLCKSKLIIYNIKGIVEMTHEVITRFEGGFMQMYKYENKSVEEIKKLFIAANENNDKFRAVILTIKCLETGQVNIIDL